MGIALFTFCFSAFYATQVACFIQQVMASTPELAGVSFSSGLLSDDRFESRWIELSTNGDVLGMVSLCSGLLGVVLVVSMTYWWKRGRFITFMAIKPAPAREFLKWTVVFLGVFAVLEFIEHLLPDQEIAFMSKVLGSTTNRLLLLIGVGVMPALFEEFLLRGLLYGSLRHVLDHHKAIAIVAGLFTLLHPQYEWYVLLLIVLPMGVMLGYARANSGSIWVPVFLHMLNNCLSILLPGWWS